MWESTRLIQYWKWNLKDVINITFTNILGELRNTMFINLIFL